MPVKSIQVGENKYMTFYLLWQHYGKALASKTKKITNAHQKYHTVVLNKIHYLIDAGQLVATVQ